MSKRESLETKREYNRKRYWRNREKILAQQKERYELEKERIKAERSNYYQNNKETLKAKKNDYYQRNAEKVKRNERQRRMERKIIAMNFIGDGCSRCEMKHPAAIDFHHKNTEEKLFSIGDMLTSRRQVPDDVLKIEVEKCELLCKNCHAIEHCKWEIER